MTKGSRRERQAVEIYDAAGYYTYRPETTQYGDNDLWNLFDIAAMRPGEKVVFSQVKSNGARGIRSWSDAVAEICPFEHVEAHFLVCHDREGWRLFEVDGDGREVVVDERENDGKMGEATARYLREKQA